MGAEGGIQRLKSRMNSARLWEETSNPDGDGGHRDGGGRVKLCVGPKLVWGKQVLGSLGGRQEKGAESRRDEGGRPGFVACCKGWGSSVDGF